MKHWQELGHIAVRVARLGETARRDGVNGDRFAALAIVTRIEGSAYRRPGAKLLIEPEGPTLGGVSGGCLEEDVRRVGLSVIASGRSRRLHYDTSDDENKVWGLGLGCNGEVDLVVVPIGLEALGRFSQIEARLRGDSPFALSTMVKEDSPGGFVLHDETGLSGRSGLQTLNDGQEVFTEVLQPPPRLLVCGAGDDARPLVHFAAAVGFRVIVADHRPAFLSAARFPEAQQLLLMRGDQPSPELRLGGETFAVVKTHAFENDRKWVARLLAADLPYVGLLGPRARSEKLLARVGPGRRDRVYAPVGLDLGADGPEQVALSVVSELLTVWAGRTPQHLRERKVALHACA
jgi:xanthine/CO dehydrogenase XdhC/CoxF family maturation factor